LAGLLALLAFLDVLLSSDWRGPLAVNVVVVPAMALALAWRRRFPLLTLGMVLGGIVCLSLAFGTSETWSYIFITVVAVYSAAAYGSHRLLAVLILAVGVVVTDLRDPAIHSFGDAVWSSSLFGLAFLAGLTGWAFQHRSSALERRAEALDREEEERAEAAVAEERRRIARELHDVISHSLGVLVLQAGAAEQVVERDPERAREVLRSIRATGQEAIGEMSTLLGLVRGQAESSREPQPSLDDVGRLVQNARDGGHPIQFSIEGSRRPLPAALELSAFRIVQEGLTNALKHSAGAPTRVVVRYLEHELQLEVSDEGTGSDNGAGSGSGLAGIGERVAVFGGRFEAGTRTGGGWTMRAELPVQR
jgi:signal transduction histidine kinase